MKSQASPKWHNMSSVGSSSMSICLVTTLRAKASASEGSDELKFGRSSGRTTDRM